jgi:regulatory protein
MKGISPFCIKKGMLELEDLSYEETGQKMLVQYYSGLKSMRDYNKKAKSAKFMIGKGFEPELVWKWVELI